MCSVFGNRVLLSRSGKQPRATSIAFTFGGVFWTLLTNNSFQTSFVLFMLPPSLTVLIDLPLSIFLLPRWNFCAQPFLLCAGILFGLSLHKSFALYHHPQEFICETICYIWKMLLLRCYPPPLTFRLFFTPCCLRSMNLVGEGVTCSILLGLDIPQSFIMGTLTRWRLRVKCHLWGEVSLRMPNAFSNKQLGRKYFYVEHLFRPGKHVGIFDAECL